MRMEAAYEKLNVLSVFLGNIMTYRGYRPIAIAYTGLWALVGTMMELWWHVFGDHPSNHVLFWICIAIAAALPVATHMLRGYIHSDSLNRSKTRTVVGQFVLCIIAGAAVTVPLIGTGEDILARLPGVWAVLFSLGIIASRPHLPPVISLVAYFYLAAGGLLLWLARVSAITPFRVMGLVFIAGQFSTAWILYQHQKGEKYD